jgi:hypothetical protein
MTRVDTAGLKRQGVVALGILWGCTASAMAAAPGVDSSVAELQQSVAELPQPAIALPHIHSPTGAVNGVHNFDIPAQPLEAALIQYGTVSGHPALFPSDIVAGRTSSAVRGSYSAEVALRRLLSGTGVAAERRDSALGTTFVLKADAAPSGAAPAGMGDLFAAQGYPGLVQTRILQALCTDTDTRPGRYRTLFRFQVNGEGRVNNARLLRSNGGARRDAAILDTLQRVRIDRAPPPALVQHRLTMLLLPSDPNSGSPCGTDEER